MCSKSKKKLTIGVNSIGYNQERNFLYLSSHNENIKFRRIRDLFSLLGSIVFKITKKNIIFTNNIFFSLNKSNVNLFHFFNTISLNKNVNWIVTIESTIPRKTPVFFVKYLARKNCKKIICFSPTSKKLMQLKMQKNLNKKIISNIQFSEIMNKIEVLLPPQKIIQTESSLKWQAIESKILECVFVGRAFFRKGGAELIEAFQKINNLNWKLTIVSDFSTDNWYDGYYSHEYKLEIIERIKNDSRITVFHSLKNSKVMELYQNSHLNILPTWGETFGYSILEAGSFGCVSVLPRINPFTDFLDDENVLFYKVPTYNICEDIIFSQQINEESRTERIDSLLNTFLLIEDGRLNLEEKANNIISRISEQHNIKMHTERLLKIYRDSITL